MLPWPRPPVDGAGNTLLQATRKTVADPVGGRCSVATSDISQIDERVSDTVATVAVVVVSVGLAAGVVVGLAGLDWDPCSDTEYCLAFDD